ncbi:hypothetical protein predicted by Glimmer/Critica [Sorangium cellulosum So ce56]|uniref:Uncharacterized protein n=1 Tax=Sorangium cellulosum (strain So ce56) TaxID=448385 RepID=A9F039_SORC5|nr:hypothetical protein [Sorangium cellulosum]CAN91232.1 hypothetical protein predicted by Glimmer/Critica [Sorangium cellulosum So ce56]
MRSRPIPRDARQRRWSQALLLALAATLGSADALAHGGGEKPLATVPAPPPGDGAKAAQILREIEGRVAPPPTAVAGEKSAGGEETAVGAPIAASGPSPGAAKVVAEPMAHAKRALQRAHGARAAGDATNARRLDAVALEWAEAARTLLRAAAAEAAAVEAAKRAREVETKLERARALLEETQARRGRAAAELERIEAEAREATRAAANVEAQRIEAGKRGAAPKAATRGARGAEQAPTAAPGAGPKGGAGKATAPVGQEGTP